MTRQVVAATAFLLLLALAGCQTNVPATPTAAAVIPTSPVASASVTSTASPTLPPAIVTPIPSITPAPVGSMAALAQLLSGTAGQMSGLMAGQVSAAQMQQAMDLVSASTTQLAPLVLQAPQGTPEVRQNVAQTLNQLGTAATQLRGKANDLTPDQRKLAIQQMQVLALDVAQSMRDVQDMTGQPSAAEQQAVTAQLQQVQSTLNYILTQNALATPIPPPPTPAATPAR